MSSEYGADIESIRAAAAAATPPDFDFPEREPFGDDRDDIVRRNVLAGNDAEAPPASEPDATTVEYDPGGVIFDTPAEPEALWGRGAEVLAAIGEPTMLYAGTGIGKTTIAQLVVLAAVGIGKPEVLGYPVRQLDGVILYLQEFAQIENCVSGNGLPGLHEYTLSVCVQDSHGDGDCIYLRNPAFWIRRIGTVPKAGIRLRLCRAMQI